MALLGGGSPFGLGGYGDNFRQTEEPYSGPSITNGMSVGLLPSGYSYLYGGGTDPFEGTAAGLYMGGGPASPSTSTTGGTPGGGGTPPLVSRPNLAPTAAQVAANPGAYAGTSFDPTRSALQGNNVPYDPNWQSLLTPWNTTNPIPTNDPLNWVRNLDRVAYQKYILPYQLNGGDTTDINTMTRLIQEGLARDGGGYWMNGNTVYTVQGPRLSWMQSPTGNAGNAPAGVSQQQTPVIGSTNNLTTGNSLPSGLSAPHQTFLQSNDPRAVYLRNLLSSGSAAEQNAARTWMHQNIVPGGTAGRPLDNINDWTSRFRNFFNLSGPGGAGGSGGAGTSSTPAGGGGNNPVESWLNSGAPGAGQDYSDWYYSNMGPGYPTTDKTGDVQYYQQWSNEIDKMLMDSGILGGQFRNPTAAQLQNDNYLQQLRQALDRARAEYGFQSYADVARLATGNTTANNDWFYDPGDYAAAPFKPNEDPGAGFQWDWVPATQNSPARWYRRPKAANTYDEYLAQITKANELRAAGSKIPIISQSMFGLFGDSEKLDAFNMKDGQYSPLAQALFEYNKKFQNSAQFAYDSGINKQFIGNYNGLNAMDIYDEYSNDDVLRAIEELNALRAQPGYDRVGYTGSPKPVSDPSWFIGSSANTPYRPEEAPFEGFKWRFTDPDGSGPLTAKTWMLEQVYNPTNLQEATDFAAKVNSYQNSPYANKMMFANNNGIPMFNATQNNGKWNYAVNPNYPTWKPAPTPTSTYTPTPTIGNQFTFPGPSNSGGGSTGGGGGGSTPTVSFTSPFGSMTGRPPRLGGGGSSFWG